eukprot:TRINITY_DN7718_c0_g1_i1.p1 TRINITY_DN7718_c0_g1~~TRINITY_DN7718_c0_g1_i1.p1  ORF type:complete len:66 (+),score=5.97 TRINITY_DN7718_c0_g1_i1:500-697(+)
MIAAEDAVAIIINAATSQNPQCIAHWLTYSIHCFNGQLYPIRVYDSLVKSIMTLEKIDKTNIQCC